LKNGICFFVPCSFCHPTHTYRGSVLFAARCRQEKFLIFFWIFWIPNFVRSTVYTFLKLAIKLRFCLACNAHHNIPRKHCGFFRALAVFARHTAFFGLLQHSRFWLLNHWLVHLKKPTVILFVPKTKFLFFARGGLILFFFIVSNTDKKKANLKSDKAVDFKDKI
jgi:hypothetical protein